ncbi:TPA: hypothetical protein ROX91_001946 [Bacillus cereus]|uniref:Phage protein n=1 Tax=Bacillus cereus TaxID=1396 RepID=A0ABD4LLL1_BACCE|nr:hypothetical protein [Bacillus cereus]MBK1611747.1 hypothetical protein [Bacillus cereus]HDX9663247.1 hypothetical protein [Bacillus cereus]
MFKGLPEFCYGVLKSTGETIVIKAGETGYFKSEDQRPADELNEIIEVTKAQRMAMEVGSMFGWHVNGANPDNWTEDGKLKEEK